MAGEKPSKSEGLSREDVNVQLHQVEADFEGNKIAPEEFQRRMHEHLDKMEDLVSGKQMEENKEYVDRLVAEAKVKEAEKTEPVAPDIPPTGPVEPEAPVFKTEYEAGMDQTLPKSEYEAAMKQAGAENVEDKGKPVLDESKPVEKVSLSGSPVGPDEFDAIVNAEKPAPQVIVIEPEDARTADVIPDDIERQEGDTVVGGASETKKLTFEPAPEAPKPVEKTPRERAEELWEQWATDGRVPWKAQYVADRTNATVNRKIEEEFNAKLKSVPEGKAQILNQWMADSEILSKDDIKALFAAGHSIEEIDSTKHTFFGNKVKSKLIGGGAVSEADFISRIGDMVYEKKNQLWPLAEQELEKIYDEWRDLNIARLTGEFEELDRRKKEKEDRDIIETAAKEKELADKKEAKIKARKDYKEARSIDMQAKKEGLEGMTSIERNKYLDDMEERWDEAEEIHKKLKKSYGKNYKPEHLSKKDARELEKKNKLSSEIVDLAERLSGEDLREKAKEGGTKINLKVLTELVRDVFESRTKERQKEIKLEKEMAKEKVGDLNYLLKQMHEVQLVSKALQTGRKIKINKEETLDPKDEDQKWELISMADFLAQDIRDRFERITGRDLQKETGEKMGINQENLYMLRNWDMVDAMKDEIKNAIKDEAGKIGAKPKKDIIKKSSLPL